MTLVACGDAEEDPVFLGPVDAGLGEDGTTPDVGLPPLGSLATSACSSRLRLEGKLRDVGTLGSRATVTSDGVLRTIKLDAEGCPGDPIGSFGQEGAVEIDAMAAAPLPGGRTLVATSRATILLDSTGQEEGSCLGASGDLVIRALQANAQGRAIASLALPPVTWLTTDLAQPGLCQSMSVTLDPPPFALARVALARNGGFVTVEQATASSPLVVARYDAAGAQVDSSAAYASSEQGKLCSTTGLLDTPAGVFVTDSACRRAVLFDQDALRPTREARFDSIPRGAAFAGDDSRVLVAHVESDETGPIVSFERISLP